MTLTPRIKRQQAIQNIINTWQDEIGEFVSDPDFTTLTPMVWELLKLGRSQEWRRGVEKFVDTIEIAREQLGQQYGGQIHAFDSLTPTGKREYCRLFRWALLQGAIYASNRA